MKKSLIALAVLAASGAAMAQSSVTLFGVVDNGVGYLKNSGSQTLLNPNAGQSNNGMTTNGNVNSRLGFRGVEDLGGGLKAGFWLEAQLQPDAGTAGAAGGGFDFSRRSTLSLMGNFGEVRLGRDLTAGYVKTSTYDLFGQVGMGRFMGWENTPVGQTASADLNGIRSSNMVSYFTPNFGGFTAAVNYGFGESAANNKTSRYIGGYAAYDNGPLSVSVGMDKNNGSLALAAVNTDRTQVSLGASYDLGMVKLSGLAQQVKFEQVAFPNATTKFNNYALGVSAPVGPGTVKAQYAFYDTKDTKADAQQLSVGYVYDLSKRTAVYGTVAFMKNKTGSVRGLGASGLALTAATGENQTGFQAGIRHAF